ncbi:sulfotransferase family protein [Marinibacterium profundimaris]|uniref:Type II secretory pathway, pullulanase PulA n=1 Tax=Marinibacterium profundimaris TaxID=1679460 RepID=A0A225NKZ5_9RHOB|nr:sulfotransferase family 2 domain-containing protein [Marinibacterium profundimaris]OWU70422.1 Type II secretory pathway, pullulanase PulA [Marinibacterium profundimaris]
MILSRGRGYVFVHIPKTGGTAMALALEGRAMKDDILLGDTPKARRRRKRVKGVESRGRLWKHSTLADIDGLVALDELKGLFAFTLVRNPWDRMVSYYHWLRAQGFDHPTVAKAQRMDFTDFASDPGVLAGLRASPAASYMTRADGVEQCALYIRLEHLDADAAPLWGQLGFRLELPVENGSDRDRDFRGYYTDAAAEAVGRACATDIARFGYAFAP